MWIADLLACGLLKASFVPPEEIQELRSLMRTRKQLVREQTRHVQRIEKTLEEANIKLGTVLSDLMGASGRRMIVAMIAGECDPHRLAALAERSVKASPKALHDVLQGRLREHHRFLLQLHLRQWDGLDAAIRQIDEQVAGHIARVDQEAADGQPPFRELIARLCAIPGVSFLSATAILAEIGRDMTRFPTAGHLIAWAGLCPGQNESAGTNGDLRACAKALLGSRPCSCNVPGLPNAPSTATTARSFIACAAGAGRRRRSVLLLLLSSPPSTTWCNPAHRTATLAPTTSTAAHLKPKPSVWWPSSPSSASRHNSNPSSRQLDAPIMLHCRGFLLVA